MMQELTEVHWQACGLDCPVMTGGRCLKDDGKMCDGAKFASAAAEQLWAWSLGSWQDETSGDAQLGNGWHALFRSERAILHTGNSGFVSAWRIDDARVVDDVWAEIEAGAAYMDDDQEDED